LLSLYQFKFASLKKEIVESYEFRSISIEEETTDMTKEYILQAIKEMDGIKLW